MKSMKAKLVKESLNSQNIMDLIEDIFFYYSDVPEIIPEEEFENIERKNIKIDEDLIVIASYSTNDWYEIIEKLKKLNIPYHIADDKIDGEEGDSILIFNHIDNKTGESILNL